MPAKAPWRCLSAQICAGRDPAASKSRLFSYLFLAEAKYLQYKDVQDMIITVLEGITGSFHINKLPDLWRYMSILIC